MGNEISKIEVIQEDSPLVRLIYERVSDSEKLAVYPKVRLQDIVINPARESDTLDKKLNSIIDRVNSLENGQDGSSLAIPYIGQLTYFKEVRNNLTPSANPEEFTIRPVAGDPVRSTIGSWMAANILPHGNTCIWACDVEYMGFFSLEEGKIPNTQKYTGNIFNLRLRDGLITSNVNLAIPQELFIQVKNDLDLDLEWAKSQLNTKPEWERLATVGLDSISIKNRNYGYWYKHYKADDLSPTHDVYKAVVILAVRNDKVVVDDVVSFGVHMKFDNIVSYSFVYKTFKNDTLVDLVKLDATRIINLNISSDLEGWYFYMINPPKGYKTWQQGIKLNRDGVIVSLWGDPLVAMEYSEATDSTTNFQTHYTVSTISNEKIENIESKFPSNSLLKTWFDGTDESKKVTDDALMTGYVYNNNGITWQSKEPGVYTSKKYVYKFTVYSRAGKVYGRTNVEEIVYSDPIVTPGGSEPATLISKTISVYGGSTNSSLTLPSVSSNAVEQIGRFVRGGNQGILSFSAGNIDWTSEILNPSSENPYIYRLTVSYTEKYSGNTLEAVDSITFSDIRKEYTFQEFGQGGLFGQVLRIRRLSDLQSNSGGNYWAFYNGDGNTYEASTTETDHNNPPQGDLTGDKPLYYDVIADDVTESNQVTYYLKINSSKNISIPISFNANDWIEALQYDFLYSKLILADKVEAGSVTSGQVLIKGVPNENDKFDFYEAGMINGTTVTDVLHLETGIDKVAGLNNSDIRIFAGEIPEEEYVGIKNGNSIEILNPDNPVKWKDFIASGSNIDNAVPIRLNKDNKIPEVPFRVYNDGTVYASKLHIGSGKTVDLAILDKVQEEVIHRITNNPLGEIWSYYATDNGNLDENTIKDASIVWESTNKEWGETKKYLWKRIQFYVISENNNNPSPDSRYGAIYEYQGEFKTSVILEIANIDIGLSNENDTIIVDSKGKRIDKKTIKTVLTVFNGSEQCNIQSLKIRTNLPTNITKDNLLIDNDGYLRFKPSNSNTYTDEFGNIDYHNKFAVIKSTNSVTITIGKEFPFDNKLDFWEFTFIPRFERSLGHYESTRTATLTIRKSEKASRNIVFDTDGIVYNTKDGTYSHDNFVFRIVESSSEVNSDKVITENLSSKITIASGNTLTTGYLQCNDGIYTYPVDGITTYFLVTYNDSDLGFYDLETCLIHKDSTQDLYVLEVSPQLLIRGTNGVLNLSSILAWFKRIYNDGKNVDLSLTGNAYFVVSNNQPANWGEPSNSSVSINVGNTSADQITIWGKYENDGVISIDHKTIPIIDLPRDGETITGPRGKLGQTARVRKYENLVNFLNDNSSKWIDFYPVETGNVALEHAYYDIVIYDDQYYECVKLCTIINIRNKIVEGTFQDKSFIQLLTEKDYFKSADLTVDFAAITTLVAQLAAIKNITAEQVVVTPLEGGQYAAGMIKTHDGESESIYDRTDIAYGSKGSGDNTDHSKDVIIFAGAEKENNKFEITKAPFIVTNDGTVYAKNLKIGPNTKVIYDDNHEDSISSLFEVNTEEIKSEIVNEIDGLFSEIKQNVDNISLKVGLKSGNLLKNSFLNHVYYGGTSDNNYYSYTLLVNNLLPNRRYLLTISATNHNFNGNITIGLNNSNLHNERDSLVISSDYFSNKPYNIKLLSGDNIPDSPCINISFVKTRSTPTESYFWLKFITLAEIVELEENPLNGNWEASINDSLSSLLLSEYNSVNITKTKGLYYINYAENRGAYLLLQSLSNGISNQPQTFYFEYIGQPELKLSKHDVNNNPYTTLATIKTEKSNLKVYDLIEDPLTNELITLPSASILTKASVTVYPIGDILDLQIYSKSGTTVIYNSSLYQGGLAKDNDLSIARALLPTGVDIYSKNIVATADNFKILNNSGETTISVNKDGLLVAKLGFTIDKAIRISNFIQGESFDSSDPDKKWPHESGVYIGIWDSNLEQWKYSRFTLTSEKILVDSTRRLFFTIKKDNGNLTNKLIKADVYTSGGEYISTDQLLFMLLEFAVFMTELKTEYYSPDGNGRFVLNTDGQQINCVVGKIYLEVELKGKNTSSTGRYLITVPEIINNSLVWTINDGAENSEEQIYEPVTYNNMNSNDYNNTIRFSYKESGDSGFRRIGSSNGHPGKYFYVQPASQPVILNNYSEVSWFTPILPSIVL